MDRNVVPEVLDQQRQEDVPRKGNVDRNIRLAKQITCIGDVPRKGNVDRNRSA